MFSDKNFLEVVNVLRAFESFYVTMSRQKELTYGRTTLVSFCITRPVWDAAYRKTITSPNSMVESIKRNISLRMIYQSPAFNKRQKAEHALLK